MQEEHVSSSDTWTENVDTLLLSGIVTFHDTVPDVADETLATRPGSSRPRVHVGDAVVFRFTRLDALGSSAVPEAEVVLAAVVGGGENTFLMGFF